VQRQQCGGLSVDAEDDVAAVASVGTVGAAERFELLAPDRGAPVPTVAGGEVNGDTIYELGGRDVLISDEGSAAGLTLHSPRTGSNPIGIDRILSGSGSDDVDEPATLAGAERHGAGSQSEEGIVSSTADVGSGMELGSTLADDDLAGLDGLTAEALDAEVLRV